jgi:hypothetical protein
MLYFQFFIDEIEPLSLSAGDGDPDRPEELLPYFSLLKYPGPNNVKDGVVAVGHRDQPTLERPGTTYAGRSIYTSFGLEGVNNQPGATSRAELLKCFSPSLPASGREGVGG